jgi:5'-3' exonuclease
MNELNTTILKYFKNKEHVYKCHKIIISTSDDFGEGEHKIFDYIRKHENEHKDKSTLIYGLDADLIMLSINHLPISKKLFLFRETPEFIKTIDASLEPNETYFLDIPELANIITLDMNNDKELTINEQPNRIYDYIFLCFFLGNDFMPHFPACNIRTGGVDKMINAYKATIGGTKEILTDGKTIYWKNVRKIVEFIASMEEDYYKNEMKLRDKREKFAYPTETAEQKYLKFEAIPNYERDLEKYIAPFKEGWQNRYYKALFGFDYNTEKIKSVATNYIEGLEWTMKYYTIGCPDWRWKYNYNYPPLFKDLLEFIPYFEKSMIAQNSNQTVNPIVQLSYVLPRQQLNLLPNKLYHALIGKKAHWYKSDCEFVWAYCRYFWESHVELPDINIHELEEFVNQTMK